jgi:hypothetical protein
MKFYDTQKDIVNTAAHKHVLEIYKAIYNPLKDLSDASRNFGISFIKQLVFLSYNVTEDMEKPINKICTVLYAGTNYKESNLYKYATGLRKIYITDKEYLSSKEVQLNTIRTPFPSPEQIQDELGPRLKKLFKNLEKLTDIRDFEKCIDQQFYAKYNIDNNASYQR